MILSKSPRIVKTKNGRRMVLSNCSVCNSKKLRFTTEPEANGLLISLGIKAPLIKLLSYVLFCFKDIK